MDEQLAEIYGTGQYQEEDDLEKTAAAELLVKLAEEQGVDLNEFSDEEVEEMLGDLYGGIEHTAEADTEMQEKFAEADYLGRIMAHSMVQELDNIEKEAGAKWDSVKSVGEKALQKVKNYPRDVGQRHRLAKKSLSQGIRGKSAQSDKLSLGERFGRAGLAAKHMAPELAAGGAVAAGIGGGVAAKIRGKKKQASAFEELAQERAYELAAEAGYIDKEASIDMELEARALEICEESGIPVEWNE